LPGYGRGQPEVMREQRESRRGVEALSVLRSVARPASSRGDQYDSFLREDPALLSASALQLRLPVTAVLKHTLRNVQERP
jgi:hypothetical protein